MNKFQPTSRRTFVSTIAKAAATSMLLPVPVLSPAQSMPVSPQTFTVQQVMDLILKTIPGEHLSQNGRHA